MSLPMFLAHGSLGPYDELIFLGVSVVFLVMMGISWFTSRTEEPPADAPPLDTAAPKNRSEERFRLD
ncbi:MAG: hypothetical protein SF029_13610 [bacterium]|nr:hypothetical protein [bacterium]